MKVVYKKTAMDRLYELKYEADRTRKKIDYFLVTPEEWVEIRSEVRPYLNLAEFVPEDCPTFETVTLYAYAGFNSARQARVFAVQPCKVLGERVVVAPKEYH